MANDTYRINYSITPSLEFSSKTSAERHLEKEVNAWKGFMELVSNANISFDNPARSVAVSSQADAFEKMLQVIDDPQRFSNITNDLRTALSPPPPHETLEGQLILGLYEAERSDEALAVYVWFLSKCLRMDRQHNNHTASLMKRGHALWTAAVASSVLPFNQVNSRKIAGAARSAENQLEALNVAVVEAEQINEAHENTLSETRDDWADKTRRLVRTLAKRESLRKKRHKEWIERCEGHFIEILSGIQRNIESNDNLNAKHHEARELEFKRLKDLFETQLRLRAPVQLWEGRETIHRTASRHAMVRFVLLALSAVSIGVFVPYCAGDYIAESFFKQICNDAEPPVCERVFSAKGPLTITGLLLVLSLIMWITRLQYRVFLSERHLSLDASEKKAFAETYLAMKEGEDVGTGNEAIVLAALFRPTQDGIIKDDESGVDLSAATILAKQLGRNS
ncbi:conserved hypothetical protein [Ruegeria sp. TrichCH4B]|nr:conserved hypothetical protein [Ruegeria sp. TrichCH4B]